MDYITGYDWPGNVRELRNFAESIITLNRDKKIELNDVLKHLNIPKQDQYLPAHINGYKQQDERQLLFGALFELKKDIMDIKHQLSAMEDMKSSNEPENGFYVSDEKIDNITFDEFEQELLTYYFK